MTQQHCDHLMIIHDKFRSGMFGQREVWEQWLRDAVAALKDADKRIEAKDAAGPDWPPEE